MDQETATRHKLRNLGQTLLLIGGMSLLLAMCSELLFGGGVWLWVFVGVAIIMFTLPDVSPRWLLRMYQARPLYFEQAPQIVLLSQELAKRAGLDRTPSLYWIPSRTVNAFSVGSKDDAAVAVTDGLLQLLSPRELAGVLAHEISHVTNNDMRLMGLADVISRMTHMMSIIGLFLVLLSLPLMLLGIASISLLAVLLLIAAPTLSALLQLGLSRIREFDADLEAARITGDPEGLASALGKIEQRHGSLWQQILFPGYRDPEPSLLRTHPDTGERIQRLLVLKGEQRRLGEPLTRLYSNPQVLPNSYRVVRRPRHRIIFGVWR
ncbi:MAG: zinc metalloprotease HtpX [Sedimenticola sp.]